MSLPLPNQADDPKVAQNFRALQQYLSGTEQSIAEALLAAQIALKAADTQPAAQAFNSTNQSIPNAVITTLALDTDIFDTDNIHDPVTNNSRLTCHPAGLYYVFGLVHWAAVPGVGLTDIYLNGVLVAQTDMTQARTQVAWVSVLAPGDYVELLVGQTSGGALNALSSGTTFSMARLSAG